MTRRPIDRGGRPSALVIGGASWNQLVYLDAFPEPRPGTLFARRHHETVGSSGAGKALNLAHLGWRTTLWALVGADVVAVTILEHCRGFLAPLKEAGVPLWIDVHDDDGENPYHADFVAAADHLQLSSVALPRWRSFAEERLDAGAETVACTHGSAGASVLTADGWVDVAPVEVADVVDTNGAGDAWFAGFAAAWHEGADPAAAGAAGVRAAAAAIRSPDLAPSVAV